MSVDAREGEEALDQNLLKALPDGGKVVFVGTSGESDYCETFRIDVELPDGSEKAFFVKEATGQQGLELMQASFLSDSAVRRFAPEHMPRALMSGAYESDPSRHFHLMDFVELHEDLPRPVHYVEGLAQLHKRSEGKSPGGRCGFEISTHFGDVAQPNDWKPTWEVFWSDMMREYMRREEEIRGPHAEGFQAARDLFFSKVIPRYLRPLQSGPKPMQPCLLHGNPWPGNIKYGLNEAGKRVAYTLDSAAFWGHNEVDVSILLSKRYKLGKRYITAYHTIVPISAPVEDYEKRGQLYLLRNHVLLSILYEDLRHVFVNAVHAMVQGVLDEEAALPRHAAGGSQKEAAAASNEEGSALNLDALASNLAAVASNQGVAAVEAVRAPGEATVQKDELVHSVVEIPDSTLSPQIEVGIPVTSTACVA